jgi:hypothetical protein
MQSNIHNYVFHYNTFNKTWSAIPRELYLDYWSKPIGSVKGILRSKDIDTLIALIEKGESFIKSLEHA